MLKNYLKIAVRNLTRNKNYSVLNIGGLALAIIVTTIIALWIYDELSYNKSFENYDQVAKVYRKNDTGMISQILTTGMGTQLKEDYGAHFKYMALLRQRLEQRVLSYDNKYFTQGGYFMQPDGTQIFSLKIVAGSKEGLSDLHSILLSESVAKKLFGEENPINKIVKMGNDWELKVTGVYKDLPQNSELNDATFFAPLDIYLYGWSDLNIWDNYNMRLYIQIQDGTSFKVVDEIIKRSLIPHVPKVEAEHNLELFLHPMSRWNLYSKFENGKSVLSDKLLMIFILGALGIFVLVLAAINFVNLSTACSEKRIKEIGVRKTLGSSKKSFIMQYLGEAFAITSFSFVIAIFIIELILPLLTEILGKELSIPWGNFYFWLSGILFTVLLSVLAGFYPAIYLSSFSPIKALKGNVTTGKLSALPRQILVVFQFSVSIVLVAAALIIYQQIDFVKSRPTGYEKDGLVFIKPRIGNQNYDVLRNELKRTGVVTEIAKSNYSLTNTRGWNNGFDWPGRDPNFNTSFNIIMANTEYGKTVGFDIIAGRDFSENLASDSAAVIINASAAKVMGLSDPIGKILSTQNNGYVKNNYTIIGVVTDMIKGSPYDAPPPAMFFIAREVPQFLYLRLNPEINASIALSKINEVFKNVMPTVPFDYEFVDEIFGAKFKAEEQLGKLSGIAAFLAIVISCLGLFGLTTFTVEKRTREIGVRKVIGASVISIMKLLAGSFAKWVIVANIFAWPVAYLLMESWLGNFAYRASFSFIPLILAGFSALVIAVLTVSIQSFKAATANPVESLRNE